MSISGEINAGARFWLDLPVPSPSVRFIIRHVPRRYRLAIIRLWLWWDA